MLPAGFGIFSLADVTPSLTSVVESLTLERTTIRIFGKLVTVPRLTCWLGDGAYTYSGRRHEPAPMPEAVRALKEHAERITGVTFNSVLANLYRDGSDSVAWHADDEPELGTDPVIASLSIGASRTFRIRHNATRFHVGVTLAHGDLIVMSGASQRDYQHSVPKVARPTGARLNLTFRTVG